MPLIKNAKVTSINDFQNIDTTKKLASEMYRISKNSIYSPSLSLLESFCEHVLTFNNESCFSAFFIYLHNNNLVAFLNANISFEIAEIDFICVSETYKKKGISTMLINLFENACKQMLKVPTHKILLEVGSLNIPAIELYKKLNFKEISIRKKYYKNGDDAVIMEKLL